MLANRSFPFNKGKRPISHPSDDFIDTGMVNWHRNGQLEFHWQCWDFSNSSRCWLIGRFPLIKGNDRLASLSMKLYYRDWVPWNDSLLELQPSGWSDTGLVQVAWHWQIGSPLAYFDIYWGRFGSSGSSVTQWLCSGTVAVHWHESGEVAID